MDRFPRRPDLMRLLYCFQAMVFLSVLYIRFSVSSPPAESSAETSATYESTLQALVPTAAAAPVPASVPATVPEEDVYEPPVNILLIGQDRRAGENRARADSAILCTYQKEERCLTLTSFLRDLYLQIPGHGGDRINAAYAYGGRDLLRQTIEKNFDIPISGCLEVDFDQFSQIIDTLGGVTLTLRQDEAEEINAVIPGELAEGLQHLNGSQTLAYSRIRNLDADGDFSRTNRQRNVMTALTEHFRDLSFFQSLSVILNILPMVSTDLDQKQILSLARQILPQLQELRTEDRSIPAEGGFRYVNIRGMEVLEPDLELCKKALDHARPAN